eukprot:TRINITY_DN83438_c0_g1_i1.p1 TRINITY_DN83438_c0_g1~~TRINITY_DN83438_c0_g1_i1.p1  ORF type:complete len:148 (+),score=15.17 TRINITY_DN83438_c0_g1_i1:35-478(+)
MAQFVLLNKDDNILHAIIEVTIQHDADRRHYIHISRGAAANPFQSRYLTDILAPNPSANIHLNVSNLYFTQNDHLQLDIGSVGHLILIGKIAEIVISRKFDCWEVDNNNFSVKVGQRNINATTFNLRMFSATALPDNIPGAALPLAY